MALEQLLIGKILIGEAEELVCADDQYQIGHHGTQQHRGGNGPAAPADQEVQQHIGDADPPDGKEDQVPHPAAFPGPGDQVQTQ